MGVNGAKNRSARVDLRRAAVLVDSDGGERAVTILDVSMDGFRLEGSEGVRIDELVHLRVEREAALPARIKWALGDEAGGVFLTAPDRSFG